MKSIWQSDIEIRKRQTLPSDTAVETLVIGAGMAGILTAIFLKKQRHQVIIVEAKEIASGQTGGTTAKITSQHGMCYHKMLQSVGKKKAQDYARANEEALKLYEQIIEEKGIQCHYEKKGAYLYTLHDTGIPLLKKEAEAAASLGIKAHFLEGNEIRELPFQVKAAVCFEEQAQFHPLEFVKHLAEQLIIYENTKVLKVKKHMVYTNRGTIKAQNIVFATHYPFINIPGFYFLRQHQERSYVLALQIGKELQGMYYGIDKNGLSLRSAGGTLLLGGGGHRTGKCKCESYAYLRKMAELYYPNGEEIMAWSAQDCMPHDGIPFIGKYSLLRPYWYVATGFHKWGMTSSMIAASIISREILGMTKKEEFSLFSPRRLLIRASFKNFWMDVGGSIKGLSKGLMRSKGKRCPHMGCALEWNQQEDSWDCPCHGSRFRHTGELEDNPAQTDLPKK